MKILNTREKQLKQYIADYMKGVKIEVVNLKKGKVTVRTAERAGTMTKAAVKNGLDIYFQGACPVHEYASEPTLKFVFAGDETMTEAAMNCILDNIDKKETTIVTLSGVKDK